MATVHDYDLSQHETRLLLGDPVAEAYAWLKAYAANLSDQITVEELIETGLTHWPDEHGKIGQWGGDYLSNPDLEGTQLDPTYWGKLRTFSELEIPDDELDQGSFFTCSC